MPPAFNEICQTSLPFAPWTHKGADRLPGLVPMRAGEWLLQDEAYAAQMAYRDHLLTTNRAAVYAHTDGAEPATTEILQAVLDFLQDVDGYDIDTGRVTRPDGVSVPLDEEPPLVTAARLIQEDLCVMEKQGDEHVLTAAVLCFPASWSLAQKIGRPMTGIHEPVEEYDGNLARRVQRLFDLMHVDRPMWRANYLEYDDADLFQPRREEARRDRANARGFSRVERQSLVKLPQTQAICFGIHTYVLRGVLRPKN